MSARGTQVTVIREDGSWTAAAHHIRGRLAGYAVRGSATRCEVEPRAADALAVENERGGDLTALLVERMRYGRARAVAPSGQLTLGDFFQPQRERRARRGR